MKKIIRFFLVTAVLIPGLAAQSQITAVTVGNRIDISIKDNLFTRYVGDENEKYPFFFPVNGPSGASVTSMRNNPYPHHTSLFIACDRVNGGNYWQEGLDRGQILALRSEIKESGAAKVVTAGRGAVSTASRNTSGRW